MSRLERAFAGAAAEGRAAFIPFLTAGFPSPTRFAAYAEALLRHGDVLEVGLPYSDPLGDGPTIQRASERALAAGVSTAGTLRAVEGLRRSSGRALVVMTYYNPIYCYRGGEGAFVRDLAAAGADGVILPDLPPDEAEALIGAAREAALDTVFLVAPTSTEARLRTVGRASRGFVYAVSVTGVTGERTGVGADIPELVSRARAASGLPVAVGFGVASRASAARVAAFADGVVVGSALVRAADEHERAEGGTAAVGAVERLAADLAEGCRRA